MGSRIAPTLPASDAAAARALAPVQALRPALKEARDDLLSQVLQALPVAVVRFDADGSVDLVNPRATQLLQSIGLRPALRSGWALLEALDATLARRTRAGLRTAGPTAERQRVFVRPAGQRPVELAVSVQVLDDRGCLVTIEDGGVCALRPRVG